MSDTRIVVPDAPRDLKPRGVMALMLRMSKRHYSREELEATVRKFADFLATTASPKGTIQREKLQSFATEFLRAGGEK